MRIKALALLLALAGGLATGCQQDQRISDAERQSFYSAPPTIAWGEKDGYRMDQR